MFSSLKAFAIVFSVNNELQGVFLNVKRLLHKGFIFGLIQLIKNMKQTQYFMETNCGNISTQQKYLCIIASPPSHRKVLNSSLFIWTFCYFPIFVRDDISPIHDPKKNELEVTCISKFFGDFATLRRFCKYSYDYG